MEQSSKPIINALVFVTSSKRVIKVFTGLDFRNETSMNVFANGLLEGIRLCEKSYGLVVVSDMQRMLSINMDDLKEYILSINEFYQENLQQY